MRFIAVWAMALVGLADRTVRCSVERRDVVADCQAKLYSRGSPWHWWGNAAMRRQAGWATLRCPTTIEEARE